MRFNKHDISFTRERARSFLENSKNLMSKLHFAKSVFRLNHMQPHGNRTQATFCKNNNNVMSMLAKGDRRSES